MADHVMADSSATVVLCGPLGSVRASSGMRAARHGVPAGQPPVTRIARLDDLLRMPVDGYPGGDGTQGHDIALAIEPAWLDSRRAIRDAIHRAHAVVPTLDSAVLAGAPLREHALLAELGIRIVVVDRLAPCGRGSRRPPPAGWPCRNVTWGLWEVERTDPARQPGLWHRLTHGSGLPTTRAGSLQVLCDEEREPGRQRLGRWVKATERRQARGALVAVRLGDLAGMLDRGVHERGAPASLTGHAARGSLLAAA